MQTSNNLNVNAPPVTLVKIRANFIDDDDREEDDDDVHCVPAVSIAKNLKKSTAATAAQQKSESGLDKIDNSVTRYLEQLMAKFSNLVTAHLDRYTSNVRIDERSGSTWKGSRFQTFRVLSEHGQWIETSLDTIVQSVQSTLSAAFNSELQYIQNKLLAFFAAKHVPEPCFMLLDRLSVEHASKFKQIISARNIKTNVLAAIGRVTAEAAKEKPIDNDIFVTDGMLCRVKGGCNIEPVISSEHRRYFEIHSMRGKIPTLASGLRLKPNPNEAMRLIANALMCNRRPKQHLLMWINGENTQSFVTNLKNIAGGYAIYISVADSNASGKTKVSGTARVAIIESSSNTKSLETKLNRLPGTVLPIVVSEPNDFTPPDCGADWLVFKYSPPSGLTPEMLFADLIQAANPNQTEVTPANITTSDDLTNDSMKAVVKEFIAQNKWSPTGATTESQRKSIPVKSIKSELSVMAAKRGIKTVSQKSIVHAFQSNGFSATNPKNVLSITCYL
jgi:hypothetical protein